MNRLLDLFFRSASPVDRGTPGDRQITVGPVDARLRSIDRKVNVLLALVVFIAVQPFLGSVVSMVKWAIILLVLIAVCIGLALFRHRIPDVSRSVWGKLQAATKPPSQRHETTDPVAAERVDSPA